MADYQRCAVPGSVKAVSAEPRSGHSDRFSCPSLCHRSGLRTSRRGYRRPNECDAGHRRSKPGTGLICVKAPIDKQAITLAQPPLPVSSRQQPFVVLRAGPCGVASGTASPGGTVILTEPGTRLSLRMCSTTIGGSMRFDASWPTSPKPPYSWNSWSPANVTSLAMTSE